MAIDSVALELHIADIMFNRSASNDCAISELERLSRDTEDILIDYLRHLSMDLSGSHPATQAAAEKSERGLQLALERWTALETKLSRFG